MSDEDLLGRVLFFNVALKNGHMMAQPVYEPQQSFLSALVLEIERINPEFAWVQLVFQMVDYHRDLRVLDSVLQDHKAEAEQKRTFTDADGRTHEEDSWKVDTRWYRTIEARTKKIDLLHAKKTLALGIQGMWAGGVADLSHLAPFAKCSDDLDVLQVFPYRDPRMLIELAGRRIVTDLGRYASGYGGRGYLEPPSLILAVDNLPYYIHLPTGEDVADRAESLKPFFGAPTEGRLVWEAGEGGDAKAKVAQIESIPVVKEALKDEKVSLLSGLATHAPRSLELVYEEGVTRLLICSTDEADLESYATQFVGIYGGIKFGPASTLPQYVGKVGEEVVKQIDAMRPPTRQHRPCRGLLRLKRCAE